jgi:hypothetical protein
MGRPLKPALRCTLLGIGAMASPRYRPAGVLVEAGEWRVMLDGGPGAEPGAPLHAWLVCDERSELRTAIRDRAASLGVQAHIGTFERPGLSIEPLDVRHTSHRTVGYRIRSGDALVVWVPEFLEVPQWVAGADLVFAEAAGWDRPIRFARGVGGHAAVVEVSRAARELGVRRLVFAHLGRPTLRALDAGRVPPFGEIGVEGRTYHPGSDPGLHE